MNDDADLPRAPVDELRCRCARCASEFECRGAQCASGNRARGAPALDWLGGARAPQRPGV
eukprot:9322044-Pyramimonas_sp.AAC.1